MAVSGGSTVFSTKYLIQRKFESLLQSATASFITKCDNLSLQSETVILLQSVTSVITECDRYYKVRQNKASSFQLRLVIVYKIPYSAVHRITTSTFFLEFSDYQDSLLLSKVPLCIFNDFNLHMDVSGDVDSVKFANLLELMCLTQHVRSPTHIQGHILDLVIIRNSDNIIQGRSLFCVVQSLCS